MISAMKKILPLLCIALCVLPVGVKAPQAHAGGSLQAVVSIGFNANDQDDSRRRRRDDDRPDRSGDRGDDRSSDRRDDRINRAIAIAQSRGRVVDAWPESGAVFWVRVTTDRGRVDLLVDTDSGRIIGQR